MTAPTVAQVETALVAWVRAATGLSADAVYLAHQNLPSRFPGPAAVISLGDLISLGADDELRWSFAPSPTSTPSGSASVPGQEIVFATNGWRRCTASVSFFTGGTTGGSSARALAIQAQAALRLPTQRATLNAAGLGVWDEGDVRWVPVLDSGLWYGQAVLDVGLVLKAEASEATGYIETYVATGTVT